MERFSQEPALEKSQEWALPDLIKKALVAGVGALFMTEEGVRSFLGDLKLPKDVIQFVVGQASKTKQDLFKALSGELHLFLESTNFTDVMRKVLAATSIHIDATMRFVPDGEGLRPKITATTKVKRKSTSSKARGKKAASQAT
ncbi:MAG TPA: hypothetical protein VM425_11620 [Myxococcota bacterium]|nr:hypothetical protein [Myxococcota bacterium]